MLGQLAAFLVILSILFAGMILSIPDDGRPHEAVLVAAWPWEHTVIATTMLAVGIFAVASWNAIFLEPRDVLVLAPLPVSPTTMFLAKSAALAVGLSLTVVALNALSSLLLPLALAAPSSSLLDLLLSLSFYRVFIAFWTTLFTAAAFVLGCVLVVQGFAAQLPRRMFLHLSSLLQVVCLCIFVATYFLEPALASVPAIQAPENHLFLACLPSYWFLGLFQQLNGSMASPVHPEMHALAIRALLGIFGVTLSGAVAFWLAYQRVIRKTMEEPDVQPVSSRFTLLPHFGPSIHTAIAHFSIRSLFRGRQHRVLLSFYTGIGFAVLILFLKTPIAQKLSTEAAASSWRTVSLPVLAASLLLTACWMLGVRIVFAMPVQLAANWIFRMTELRGLNDYLPANRRTMLLVALFPVWLVWAVALFCLWPLIAAIGHLAVLGLLGLSFVGLSLHRFHKIPFACSYLPGKSNVHLTAWFFLTLGLNAIYWAASFERRTLANPAQFACTIGVVGLFASLMRWHTQNDGKREEAVLRFEESSPPLITPLGLHRDGSLPVANGDVN